MTISSLLRNIILYMTCLQWVHSASYALFCNIFNNNNKKNNNYNNQYAHAHITLYMLYSATSQRLCGTPQESARAPKGERWALNKYERPGGVEYVAPKGSKQCNEGDFTHFIGTRSWYSCSKSIKSLLLWTLMRKHYQTFYLSYWLPWNCTQALFFSLQKHSWRCS